MDKRERGRDKRGKRYSIYLVICLRSLIDLRESNIHLLFISPSLSFPFFLFFPWSFSLSSFLFCALCHLLVDR